jgi:hypothetical protein
MARRFESYHMIQKTPLLVFTVGAEGAAVVVSTI